MPRTLCWRCLVLAATVGAAAAVVGVMPAHARADELIASFVRDSLESPPLATMPLGARPSSVASGLEMNPLVGFAPIDQGTPGHRKRVQAAHSRRQALRKQLTLSALILMIFNVPAMPSLETTGTGSVLSGSGNTSVTQGTTEIVSSSSSSSSSPPTASEPTALVSSFLGCGLTGVFTVLRRRTRRRRRRLGG
jgi:hypothetical protein